jgi:Rad3-related DNA helicase
MMPPLDVDHLLGPSGLLAAVWPAFEHRSGQLEMARGVSDVLAAGGVLAVEAPTGIGKSLAYLLPGILHQRAQGLPVAVATHTINLQDQLLDKDVPLVAAALAQAGALGGEPLRVAVIKGRTNYLCRRRYEEARRGLVQLRPGTLERLIGWVNDTETGDLTEAETEIGALGPDRELLAADPASCAWGRCHRGNDCFLRRLRDRAATSHLVILNHALLIHHLLRDSAFLPDADALILDEAHHLERTLTEAGGREVSYARLQGLSLRALGREPELRGLATEDEGEEESAAEEPSAFAAGSQAALAMEGAVPGAPVLGALGRTAERLRAVPSDVDRLALMQHLGKARNAIRRGAAATSAALRAIAERLQSARELLARTETGSSAGTVLTRRYNAEESADLLEPEAARAESAAAEAARLLRELAQAIEKAARPPAVDPAEALADLAGIGADWTVLAEDWRALRSPADHDVSWAALASPASASLHSLPLEVADTFAGRILDRYRSTILTSATLTVGGSFDHLAARLGLDRRDRRRTHFLALDSPFEHERQSVLLADPSFVPPTAPGYAEAVTRILAGLLRRVPRRTLVLFTSHYLLRTVHAALAPLASALGRPLLAQGVHGSRQGIAARHRRDRGSMLLGTASFWEGVDFPGEELEVLVITRLPFPVPGEPLIAARGERLLALGEEPFTNLFLPEAVLRFRQGFGRLIRSLDDRGAVLCLDPRLLTARYGEVFVSSLPVAPALVPGSEFVSAIEGWFETGELAAPAAQVSDPLRRGGSRKTLREVIDGGYVVDRLEFDPGAGAVSDRESEWRGQEFVTDDGITIFVERLRRSRRRRPNPEGEP